MAKPKGPYPRGVWFTRKRLSGGDVVRYGYYGRGVGMEALGREGSAEFFARLAEVLRKEPPTHTTDYLIYRFKRDFLPTKKPRTQADYAKYLDAFKAEFGKLSLRALSSDAIVPHLLKWRDRVSESPRQRDYAVQVAGSLLSWGAKPEQRLISKNQAAGIARLYSGDRSAAVWTDEQIAAFLEHASEPLSRAMILALETGQRQGDLLRLTWNNVSPHHIALRQEKTCVDVAVPISPRLRKALDDSPRGDALTVLTSSRGMPWDIKGNSFRAAWRDVCVAAGIEGVTFHDLRGTFATRRFADGWSREDVAFCTGHSLRDLASLERYVDRKSVAAQRAERLALRMQEAGK